MKNEKQIKIDGYKCIKLDEWKTGMISSMNGVKEI